MATESPDGTTIRSWSDAPIVDAEGNEWKLTNVGGLTIDGIPDRGIFNIVSAEYASGTVYAYVTGGSWWSKASPFAPWRPAPGGAPPPSLSRTEAGISNIQASLAVLSTSESTFQTVISEAIGTLQTAVGSIAATVAAIKQTIDDLQIPQRPKQRIVIGPLTFTEQPEPTKPGP